jgi:hypothetical protein
MRLPAFAASACLLGALIVAAPADATLQTVIGARSTIPSATMDDCSTRASNTIKSVLANATEAGQGSAEWFGVQRPDPQSPPSALAVIECHPQDGGGYFASFTCSAQVPGYPGTAQDLCDKLEAAFAGAAK